MGETTISDCDRCNGSGERYDATEADKVNAGPFAGQCSHCRGTGRVAKIVLPRPAYLDVERAATQPECDSTAELPAWMLEF